MASDSGGRWVAVYVGIGSNLRDPESQVRRAFSELARLPESRLVACSFLYHTEPVGRSDQPRFVNAAARLDTCLDALELLASFQVIERLHGRVRDGTRWGPRPLDLDLLLVGDQVVDLPGLQVPHPELPYRGFVLVPLADIAPDDLQVPGWGTLAELLGRCDRHGIQRLAPAVGCWEPLSLAES